MKSRIDRTFAFALLVEPRELKSLEAAFREHFDALKISARCRDGTRLEPKDLDELVGFDNLSFRRIESVEFSAGSLLQGRATTNIGGFRQTAEMSVACNEDSKTIRVASEIESIVKEMRPWYSFLARTNLVFVFLAVSIAMGLGASLGEYFGVFSVTESRHDPTTLRNVALFFYGLLVAVTYLANRLWCKFFPRVFFAIGKQVQVYEKILTWRKTVFGTLLLGIVASVIANAIV